MQVEVKHCPYCNETKPPTEFYINRKRCKKCLFSQVKEWQIKNREKSLEYQRKTKKKEWQERKEVLSFRRERWGSNNKDWISTYNKTYREKNPEVVAKLRRLREHSVKVQTPKWCNKTSIKEIYLQCRLYSLVLGIEHEVDHIIPLQGKTVSGLHVENNLQILTKSQNRKKKNHYDERRSS